MFNFSSLSKLFLLGVIALCSACCCCHDDKDMGCPDLIVSEIFASSLDVDCFFNNDSAVVCTTTVAFEIENVGTAPASAFNVRIVMDPTQSVVVNRFVSGGLAAGASTVLTVVSPPGGNCYDPDCEITVTADSDDSVDECDESNNDDSLFRLG